MPGERQHSQCVRLGAYLSDDKANIFVVLTAREFSPNIRIISRAIHSDTEATIAAGSLLMGKSLREASIPRKTGLLVLTVQKNGERRYPYNPEADNRLETGDIIVVMDKAAQIDQVRRMA